jgi:hypothetical protein
MTLAALLPLAGPRPSDFAAAAVAWLVAVARSGAVGVA